MKWIPGTIFFVLGYLVLCQSALTQDVLATPQHVVVDQETQTIRFSAVVMAKKWEQYISSDTADPDHWHLIISATQSNPAIPRVPIFSAWATDVEISEALAQLGAQGKPFDKRTFKHRQHKKSKYPDQKPEGTPLKITASWTDKKGKQIEVDVNDFLYDEQGTKIEPVYIGKQHASHCVVCLYGCVGAVCPNQSLTVRDYYQRGHRWKIKRKKLPQDGSVVTITMTLLPGEK
jgi:hypothetical protein